MKIDRLLGETIYLLNHGRMSATVLAERFEVSKRTIFRDMDTLCIAGIPVRSNYGGDGGYEIMDTFRLQQQVAGQTDYGFIISALQALLTAYRDKDLEATIEKMKSLTDVRSNLMIDLSVAHENVDQNALLFLLNKAIENKQTVQFQYTNSEGKSKEIEVEPALVMYRWYNWYLVGYRVSHKDYRMYKVVRMDSLQILPKHNSHEHDSEQILAQMESQPDTRNLMTIRLSGDASIRSRCKEYLNGTFTKDCEDGTFEYEFTVPNGEQFWYGMLLSFGGHAKVLSPDSLIARIKEDLHGVLERYSEES